MMNCEIQNYIEKTYRAALIGAAVNKMKPVLYWFLKIKIILK